MTENGQWMRFLPMLGQRPHAMARVLGSEEYPSLSGNVWFFQTPYGVLVMAEFVGLPDEQNGDGIFAFHIHSGSQCSGNSEDPFADAGVHFNPNGSPHPEHAGDMPPLFGNRGLAFQVFLTDRFAVRDIINRTVVVHAKPDDFTTQPAGNSGKKIACGPIRAF